MLAACFSYSAASGSRYHVPHVTISLTSRHFVRLALRTSRSTLVAFSLLLVGLTARAQTIAAPNVVTISDKLVTSGQPTAHALAGLGRLGFQAVIYLAPNTVADAIKEEPEILARQGIEFVHIPIPFGSPEEKHFIAASAALERLKSKKVLVHCQINLRASSIVFLHRVIWGKEDPARAYEAVAAVWSPERPWRRFLEAQLSRHDIKFEPY